MATTAKKKPAAKAKPAKAKKPAKATSVADAIKALPDAIATPASRKAVSANADRQQWPSRNRATGAVIALLDNREGAVTKDAEAKWYAACMKHGVLLLAPTVRLASHYRGQAEKWCPECKAEALEKARAAGKAKPRPDRAAKKDGARKASEAKAKAKPARKPAKPANGTLTVTPKGAAKIERATGIEVEAGDYPLAAS
jgi:hypothetical protein